MNPLQFDMRRIERMSADPPYISPELAGCFARTPERPNSWRYLVYDDTEQLAFMSVDLKPDFFLYEIYVVRHQRGNGIGTWMLAELDNIARKARRKRIFVRPIPLDGGDPNRLKKWYEQNGYTPSEAYADSLEKLVP
jgi:GNAT superfamily N-acetyltransferase